MKVQPKLISLLSLQKRLSFICRNFQLTNYGQTNAYVIAVFFIFWFIILDLIGSVIIFIITI